MRTLTKVVLFAGLAVYLSACSKTENAEGLQPMSGKAIDVASGTAGTLDSWSEVRNKDWVYAESYTGWSTTAPKLVYRYGKPTNAVNPGSAKMRFNDNGTYTETTGTTVVTGSYTIDGSSTITTVINGKTSSYKIQQLNFPGVGGVTSYQLYLKPTNTDNWVVWMQPLPRTDSTKTIAQMLANKTWMYYSYYQNYHLATSNLAFSLINAARPLDLSSTRVTYNADGTYQETATGSPTLTGRWTVTGNQLSISITGGSTFVSTFKVMQPNYWEWVSQDGQNAGIMIPQ